MFIFKDTGVRPHLSVGLVTATPCATPWLLTHVYVVADKLEALGSSIRESKQRRWVLSAKAPTGQGAANRHHAGKDGDVAGGSEEDVPRSGPSTGARAWDIFLAPAGHIPVLSRMMSICSALASGRFCRQDPSTLLGLADGGAERLELVCDHIHMCEQPGCCARGCRD